LKKVQRSFVVEYKSGRRRPDSKSNSIWGNMDLKSVALDVEEESTPSVLDMRLVRKPVGEISLSKAEPAGLLLTSTIEQHTTAAVNEGTTMADEIDTITTTDAATIVETPVAPKKQRKPRANKAMRAAPADAAAAAEPTIATTDGAEKQKRGRKAKLVDNVGTAKRAPVKRAQKAVHAGLAAPAVPIDKMADLLQLEEENQRLRKLLAERLRAENADLRKRLNLD
jgi:hypothetical protein